MGKSIEYGTRTPKSDFDKRANDTNNPTAPIMVKGKIMKQKGGGGKQTKGFGASRS